jgi:hypothetical protein
MRKILDFLSNIYVEYKKDSYLNKIDEVNISLNINKSNLEYLSGYNGWTEFDWDDIGGKGALPYEIKFAPEIRVELTKKKKRLENMLNSLQ